MNLVIFVEPLQRIDDNTSNYLKSAIRIVQNNGFNRVFFIVDENNSEMKKYILTIDCRIPLNILEKNSDNELLYLFLLTPHLANNSFCFISKILVYDEIEFNNYILCCLQDEESDGILAVTKYINGDNPYCIAMNAEDKILKYSKTKEGYNWTTGGIYFLNSRILTNLKNALENNISTLDTYLKYLVTQDYSLKAYIFRSVK
jgi:NDP-sugar pyrophosphorylase family protein